MNNKNRMINKNKMIKNKIRQKIIKFLRRKKDIKNNKKFTFIWMT